MSDEADEADDLTALQWAGRDAMVYPNRVLPVVTLYRAYRWWLTPSEQLASEAMNEKLVNSGFWKVQDLRAAEEKVVQAVQKVLAAESVPASDRAEKAEARIAQLEEAMGQARELVGSYEATRKDEPGIKTLGMAVQKMATALSTPPSDWLAAHDRELGMRAYLAGARAEKQRQGNLLPAFPEEVLNGT